MTVTPERMIRVVKFCSTLNGCWPLPPNASKETVRRREMWWIFSMVFSVHAIVQCYQGIARKPENSVKITKTITEVSSVVLAFFKMSICKYHRESLKAVAAACDEYLTKTSPREREVIQSCISRCTPLYVMLGVSAIIAWAAFAISPLYVDGVVKVSEIQYALPYEDTKVMTILIYVSEIITIAIAASAAFVDMQMGIFIWYFGTRFYILGERFLKACTNEEFDNCIVEHQELLEFVQNIVVPTRRIAVSLTGVLVFSSVCSAYQLVSDEPLLLKLRFAVLLSAIAMEVLMYSWPSDYLKTTSADIASAVLYAPWINADSSQTSRNKVSFVIMRAQKAVVMQINGFLAVLDMEFYKTYLTTSFSYFTTLRAVTA